VTGQHTAVLGLLLTLGTRCDSQSNDPGDETTQAEELHVGLRHFTGLATIDGAYTGWEAFAFTSEQGQGQDLCQIRYQMVDTAPRSDCPDCLWAFDLASSAAGIEEESGAGCVGLGVTTDTFEGLHYSYGYAEVSGGYEQVLMYQVGDYGWYPVCYATWDEPRFQYDWEMELYYY